MVDSVLYDANGKPLGLKLRNPYGSYVNITDLAHLHFCIGRATAWDVVPDTGMFFPRNFVFQEVFVNPIQPVTQKKLVRSIAAMAAARTLALRLYESRILTSTPMVRTVAQSTAPSESSPFEMEWDF
jgi:hypothetical protein